MHAAHRFAALVLLLAAHAARADEYDSVMYREPGIPVARVERTFPDGLAELWLAALDRPDRDTASRAALSVAAAHEAGMPGLARAVPALTKLLGRDDKHPGVRAAAARALVALDRRAAAAALWEAATDSPDVREVVEPALAKWNYQPARDAWLGRLTDPRASGRPFHLALEGLAHTRDERAVSRLRELALAPTTAPAARLAVARSLGDIRTTGAEDDAKRLAADAGPRGLSSRLAAVALLRRHTGEPTVALLQALARDPEPAVATAALVRLGELGTAFVLPVLSGALASPDPEARAVGVEALFRHPSDERVRLLAARLTDPDPLVRAKAREALQELAADRRPLVLDLATAALGAADWRGQEQAAVLLARLGHHPAAKRLVALLTSDRDEVCVASAWALRTLAVPDTLAPALAHVRGRHAQMLKLDAALAPAASRAGLKGVTPAGLDRQLAQLAQFFGAARYAEADGALRALMPRVTRPGFPPATSPVQGETRAAAVWALGRLHEGKPDAELVGLLEGRLTGDPLIGRDDHRVRRMAAVALARMGAKQSLPVLRECSDGADPTAEAAANACRWAVAQLTGEPLPPPGVVKLPVRDWFLVPLEAK